MYPLNMTHKSAGGYAVANDEGEHETLSNAGYEPKFEAKVEVAASASTDGGKPSDGLKVDELKAALTAKGIAIPEGALKADLAALLDAA